MTPETERVLKANWNDINAVMLEWTKAQAALNDAKLNEAVLRKAVFELKFPNPSEGTQRAELGNGYFLKAVHKINYTLDDKDGKTDKALEELEKTGNEGAFLADRLVSWKPELSISEYRKLAPQYKAIIDTVLTTRPGMPTLEIETPKEK